MAREDAEQVGRRGAHPSMLDGGSGFLFHSRCSLLPPGRAALKGTLRRICAPGLRGRSAPSQGPGLASSWSCEG